MNTQSQSLSAGDAERLEQSVRKAYNAIAELDAQLRVLRSDYPDLALQLLDLNFLTRTAAGLISRLDEKTSILTGGAL